MAQAHSSWCAARRLAFLSDGTLINNLLARIPEEWMSHSAKEFAAALTCYSLRRLQAVLQ